MVFIVKKNELASLEFCPEVVGRSFSCENNPKLKEIQEVTDFKLIYLEHKKILITKFSDKQQIIAWLDKYKVKNYTLVSDKQYGFIVNVNGDVDLRSKKLFNIPVKFSEVTGIFNCSHNQLTSLEFSPQTVNGNFFAITID